MILRLATIITAILWCFAANAATYNFSQNGFVQGSTVTGSFTGFDSDNNGWIESSKGEVSSFSMTFNSGSPLLNNFTSSSPVFLNYRVGGGYIGDDPYEYIATANIYSMLSQNSQTEGWGAAHTTVMPYYMQVLLGCTNVNYCSKAFNLSQTSIQFETSHGLVVIDEVQAVPIPAAAWLFGPTIFGVLGFRRSKSHR
ncbi:MAG: hypothetical protein AXA67_01735 [Methylothermaceae bacteria B42]|nr:MAG: hypothetical protein AXA67_01735 [Methylothermaceae bacteria B42]HHJ38044.1 hypothetical protein [Methylothermaceae bacterium]